MKLMKNYGIQFAGDGARTESRREWGALVSTFFAKGARRAGQRSRGWGTPLLDMAVEMGWFVFSTLLLATVVAAAMAQAVNTTTVQGTVYLANGQPGTGTLVVRWPSFTTATGQTVAADSTTLTIPADGFVSIKLAPNQGATPAGEYYTAVFYMSDGTVSTQYWVIPAAAQASLAQVESQVMPAAQAVQAVNKTYVDQAISELEGSLLTASGGTLSGPLYLNGDPSQPLQAATKHYVDTQVATAVPLAGGTVTGAFTALQIGAAYQVDQFPGADFGAKLQACLNALSTSYGGTCDARNFTGNLAMGSSVTIATGNAAVLLPCATIATANQIVVTAGTRNVALRGCAMRGGSAASGSRGGTAFAYTGSGAMVQVGDPTYATNTPGFHMDNVVINTTGATAATAQGLVAYRTQEMDLEDMYFLGNANQTGMTLDGTGNYTGGTFRGVEIGGFQTAVNAIGHQVANPATTDWMNASTFVRVHIDCPTSNGSPISGTYGINLQQGDGNTFTGGDVEGCSTMLHLGPNAQNNTFVGLRNENSTNQVVADAGSSYNNWTSGGTIYTGKLTDNGKRNSFFDPFHRSFNGMNGDWYGSEQDATVTNHFRLGTGTGNERGLQDEYQTDYGYRWEVGPGDGTTGEQFYNITDLLNNVQRIGIGQYLSATPDVVTNVMVNNGGCYNSSSAPTIGFSGGGGSGASATANMATTTSLSCPGGYTVGSVTMTSAGSGYTSQPTLSFTGSNQTSAPNAVAEITTAGSTNNQTVINSAGTGAVVLNGSNGSGTGGVIVGSGGTVEGTVATIGNTGNAQFNGTLLVGGTSQSTGTITVRNNADAEVDYYLWPGLTTSQKGSYTYKDWNGNSQWYMVKDANNNWALNSAIGGLDSFKAYQSINSGDTYINASNPSGRIRLNFETGSGAETDIYSGSSSSLDATFAGPTSIKFPGLAASSGYYCMQVDSSGYLSNTGSACGSGSGGTSGTINSGNAGQIAYYTTAGTTVGGMSSVPVSAGGTGASTAATALANLGGISASGGTVTGSLTATGFVGPLMGNVTGRASGNLLPANNLGDVASAAAAVSNLLPGVTSDGKQGMAVQGNITPSQSIPVTSPYADIRAYGAEIDNATDIGPALQNVVNALAHSGATVGSAQTILLPCYKPGSGTGCYWANPSALSIPNGFGFNFKVQGGIKLGSTLTAYAGENWYGDGGVGGTQFQNGHAGGITGPSVNGTIGTTIASTGSPVTLTPTFTTGTIANLPPGSAITIAENGTCTATATRVTLNGLGFTTLTCATALRIPVDALVNVTGCSDSSFNISNGFVSSDDYPLQQIGYYQTNTTPSTATGCTVTGLNDDKEESDTVFCSNGVVMSGAPSGTACGTGQISIVPNDTHSSIAQWGEVAVLGSAQSSNPQVFDNLSIGNCYGFCFWGSGGIDTVFNQMGFSGGPRFTSGAVNLSTSYNQQFHNSVLIAANSGQNRPPCPSGGCTQPSYPFALLCDNSPSGIFYGSGGNCGTVTIDQLSTIYGGIKIGMHQGGTGTVSGSLTIKNTLFEEVPTTAILIDNRNQGVNYTTCLNLEDIGLQDNLTDLPLYYIGYTDSITSPYTSAGNAGGCVEMKNMGTANSGSIANKYFSGRLISDNNETQVLPTPQNQVTTAGVFVTGNAIKGEIEGEGAGLGPAVLPFGSLPLTFTQATLATSCSTNCTATSIVGPDGPSGNMGAVRLTTSAAGTGHTITIATDNRATYAGDAYIFRSWVRPYPGFSTTSSSGTSGYPNPFLLVSGSDTFAQDCAVAPNGAYVGIACPGNFATAIQNNGWYPQVAIASVTAGNSNAHNISFQLGFGGGSSNLGNDYAQPCWAFIPGPNNPAYTGVTVDQIVEARQDQYHGNCPPNMPAGAAATSEPINTGAATLASLAIPGAPSGSYAKADGTGFGAVPQNAAVIGANSSGQLVASSTTGSGMAVLATSPTLSAPIISGNAAMQGNVTLQNGANSNQTLAVQPGTSADQIGALQFNNYSGTSQWQLRKDASNYLRFTDAANSLDRGVFYQNGNTIINAGAGSNAVAINNTSGSGTGGFTVYEGGSNYSTAALQVTGAGNTTATGFLQGKFVMGTGTMTLTAGAASGTSPSITCATGHVCDGVSGTVALTTGTGPTTGTLATLGFPNTHTNSANCIIRIQSASGELTTITWAESTTAIILTANAAPAASTAYTVKYWCGGN